MTDAGCLARDCGYEIARDGRRVLFGDRATLGPFLVFAISGGLSLMALVWTIIVPVMVIQKGEPFTRDHAIAVAVIFGVAALAALAAFPAFRAWRRRAAAPLADLPGLLTADLDRGALLDRSGAELARFADIEASIDTDPVDHSRGLMLLLVLRWPRGKARVFKTNDRAAIERVKEELRTLGVIGRA